MEAGPRLIKRDWSGWVDFSRGEPRDPLWEYIKEPLQRSENRARPITRALPASSKEKGLMNPVHTDNYFAHCIANSILSEYKLFFTLCF